MTSQVLARLERQLKLKKEQAPPQPAGNSDLGAALEQLIDTAVEKRLEEVAKHITPANSAIPEHRRPFTDKPDSSEFPGPPAHTAPPKDLTVHLTRNEVGRVHKVSIGKTNFVALRNSDGQLIGMRQEDD